MTPRAMFIKGVLVAYKIRCGCGMVYSTTFDEIKRGLGPQGYNKYVRHYLDHYTKSGHHIANTQHYVEAYDTFRMDNQSRRKVVTELQKRVMRMLAKGYSKEQIFAELAKVL